MSPSSALTGPELPAGTVTFLFTDIEGSTKLWQAFPDAMPAALARHHVLLRQAIESHSGYVFQIIGDAFCAAFETAAEGLGAALDAQRALREEVWGEIGAMRVRMALHTGAVHLHTGEFTSGEYVSGITLSRAARLLSAGHGGQILLSLPTAELVRDQMPVGVTLRDLGSHRLKDLMRPDRVFQAVAPDVESEFAPLKTLNELPNNLPIQLTSFVGRDRAIGELETLLETERLVTLTGMGGTGKTRLALQVSAELLEHFPHGVWFVELASIADPQLVPQTVASALQLRELAGRTTLQAVTDFLHNRQILLLLDNCEHLIYACAELVDHLLRHCSALHVLATSREPLGIAGEVIRSVPSLALPQGDSNVGPEALEQYEAIQLFTARVRAVQPNFALTESNSKAVIQICTRLDGIPLALELAAARVRGIGVEQIAARLDQRFRLFTGGSRTALPRHQTLGALIDWSYDLLSEPERGLFRRLAVFSGPFTLNAAEEVCSGDAIAADEVLDLLLRVLDKSLVTSEDRDGETYYRLLETIRQYARDKLFQAGEAERFSERHAEYFLRLSETADGELRGPNQIEWLKRLEVMRDNLRAALEWLLETLQTHAALQMTGKLDWFWSIRSDYTEARQWLGRAVALPDAAIYPGDFANALTALAHHTWLQYGAREARPPAEQALSIAREQRDTQTTARALLTLGLVAAREHSFPEAKALLHESRTLYKEVGDAWSYANALICLAFTSVLEDDEGTSLVLYEQALAEFQKLGDRYFASVSNRFIGRILVNRGDWQNGVDALRRALRLAEQLGSKFESAAVLWEFAQAVRASGNFELAVQTYLAAKNIFDSLGSWQTEDTEELETLLASCRAALGDSAFTAATTRGRNLTMEQVIALALQDQVGHSHPTALPS